MDIEQACSGMITSASNMTDAAHLHVVRLLFCDGVMPIDNRVGEPSV